MAKKVAGFIKLQIPQGKLPLHRRWAPLWASMA